MKQDYICVYAYEETIITVVTVAENQFDAANLFRDYIFAETGWEFNYQSTGIRVRPIDMLKRIEV